AHPGALFSGYAEGGLLERGQFEAGLWTWSIGPDPDGVFPLEHSSQIPSDQNQRRGSNFGRFSNPDLDRNLDRGRSSLNTVERARSYAAFERAYARLGFELPLFERVLVVLASPHLHNVAPNPAVESPSVHGKSRIACFPAISRRLPRMPAPISTPPWRGC